MEVTGTNLKQLLWATKGTVGAGAGGSKAGDCWVICAEYLDRPEG